MYEQQRELLHRQQQDWNLAHFVFSQYLVRHKVTIQIHSKCQKPYIRPVEKSKYKQVKSFGWRIESFFLKKERCTGVIVPQKLNHKTDQLSTMLNHNSGSAIKQSAFAYLNTKEVKILLKKSVIYHPVVRKLLGKIWIRLYKVAHAFQ